MKRLLYTVSAYDRNTDTTREHQLVAEESESVPGKFIGCVLTQRDGYMYAEFTARSDNGREVFGAMSFAVKFPQFRYGDWEGAEVKLSSNPIGYMSMEDSRLGHEMYGLALSLAEQMDEAYAEQMQADREKRERLRAEEEERRAKSRREYEERRAAEREERAKAAAERQVKVDARREALQWYVGQNMRLRRKGKRATVFGHIEDITERGRVLIRTERDALWREDILNITKFEIKYEGDRTFTEIELPGAEPEDSA
jgi:hypothetical protein